MNLRANSKSLLNNLNILSEPVPYLDHLLIHSQFLMVTNGRDALHLRTIDTLIKGGVVGLDEEKGNHCVVTSSSSAR